ncbi:unnamed protein product [Arctia plantaginis]|uniref:Uncharacterized protein n=1 Tax=Arctia plantaginis TaxID=874455 RepID=A0A8S0Z4B3_ARCPL|nr:unnamed protein product [Arctia plantaginis]
MSASQRKVAARKPVAKKLEMDSSPSGVSSAVSALAGIGPSPPQVKASRNLREKVLTKTVRAMDPAKQTRVAGSAVPQVTVGPNALGGKAAEQAKPEQHTSSKGSDIATCTAEPGTREVSGGEEPAASEASVETPNDQILQRIFNWQQEDLSPMPVVSDDESAGSVPNSPSFERKRRPSLLVTSGKRLGVEMDAATREANEALLRGKEALESSGNIKREFKQTTLESLQTLYEIVLALSDSRSRHKENLEKERSRHARELVRAERAHSREMSELHKRVATGLDRACEDIKETLEESKAVRNWLGYETREPFDQIGQIGRSLADLGVRQEGLADRLAQLACGPADSYHQDLTNIKTGLEKMSSRVDTLRRDLERTKEECLRAGEVCREVLSAVRQKPDDHGVADVKGHLADIRKEVTELSKICLENRATVGAMSASQRKVAARKPVAKKLEMDSSPSGVSSAVSALAGIGPSPPQVKASRNLREKVLTKTVRAMDPAKQTRVAGSAVPLVTVGPNAPGGKDAEQAKPEQHTSSKGSDIAACTAEPGTREVSGGGEPAASEASVETPNDQILQRIFNWQQEDLSPMPVVSDDESAGSVPNSPSFERKRRPSLLVTSGKRLGVEMDAATREANEALLRGKEALESSGNIKREFKQTTLESLQTLYEIVLALSDSRSRHKENLEKERSRHARELVRAERAHSREMSELHKRVATGLDRACEDIKETLEESKAVRNWLGYETREPFDQIGQIGRSLADLGVRQEGLLRADRDSNTRI